MSSSTKPHTPDAFDLARLEERAADLVKRALSAGADAADAVVGGSQSLSIDVRNGQVEESESAQNTAFTLRVFVGQRSASVSTNGQGEGAADTTQLAERAVAMAKVSPEDPHASLATKNEIATDFPDLDLYDASQPSAEELKERALICEEAALSVKGVAQSGGASASAMQGATVLATSEGFIGGYAASRFSNAVSVIAGEGTSMQRDYDFDSRRYVTDLRNPSDIGHQAGERAVRRLNPTTLSPQKMPVIFDPRMARSLLSSFAGAINGASVARGTTFLRDALGEAVFPSHVRIIDEPHLMRGAASRPFDGEGRLPHALTLVQDGRVAEWLLDGRSASELGLKSNARASRSGSSTSPSSTNLTLCAGAVSPQDLMEQAGRALYVTELIGQGVNLVTGDYSRGVSGHIIENGAIGPAVSEITIASNLRIMFETLLVANDLEILYGTNAPTVMVAEMTVGGR